MSWHLSKCGSTGNLKLVFTAYNRRFTAWCNLQSSCAQTVAEQNTSLWAEAHQGTGANTYRRHGKRTRLNEHPHTHMHTHTHISHSMFRHSDMNEYATTHDHTVITHMVSIRPILWLSAKCKVYHFIPSLWFRDYGHSEWARHHSCILYGSC